jgi:hypothetical protein
MAIPESERHDSHPTLTAEQARQGKELGVMRYVLPISIGLSVLAGIVIWTIFFG